MPFRLPLLACLLCLALPAPAQEITQSTFTRFQPDPNPKRSGCMVVLQISQWGLSMGMDVYAMTLNLSGGADPRAVIVAQRQHSSPEQMRQRIAPEPVLPPPEMVAAAVGKGARVEYKFVPYNPSPPSYLGTAPRDIVLPQAMAMARGEPVTLTLRATGEKESRTVTGGKALPDDEMRAFTACLKSVGLDPGAP